MGAFAHHNQGVTRYLLQRHDWVSGQWMAVWGDQHPLVHEQPLEVEGVSTVKVLDDSNVRLALRDHLCGFGPGSGLDRQVDVGMPCQEDPYDAQQRMRNDVRRRGQKYRPPLLGFGGVLSERIQPFYKRSREL